MRREFFYKLEVKFVLMATAIILVAKTLARPIKRLADEMATISETNLQSGLEAIRRDEIGQLQKGFLRMLRRLRQAAEERRKAQNTLIQTKKLAALGTLVSGVSHEINNPLAGLYNCLRRIDARPEDAEQTKKYATLMRKALAHIEHTVQNLLNFLRQKKVVHKRLNLNEVVAASLELLAYKLQKRGVDKQLRLDPRLPMISGDTGTLEQVFVNLIMNAADAMPEGGTLAITTQSCGGEVIVEVRDTGRGMPASALGKIFDPFYTTKEVGQGTGLGLSICKRFVTDHHGTIEVESEEGKGATFRLQFPVLDEKAASKKSRVCAAVLAGGKSSRMGKNKALLSLNGKTLIEHVTGAALAVTDFVQVITNAPKEYAFLKLPMLGDEIKDIGPLGGIYTALKHCEAQQCLIIACDLPFLSVELLRFLSENAGTADIFTIDAGKGVEPLCAVYSTACLPAIEKQIAERDYKVARLFERVEARVVRFHPGHSLYTDNLFYNVNTPEDFEELLVN